MQFIKASCHLENKLEDWNRTVEQGIYLELKGRGVFALEYPTEVRSEH